MNIKLAAIIHGSNSTTAQTILETFITRLQSQGFRIGGLTATEYTRRDGKKDKCIRGIESGILYPIFQNLGNDSESCRLNPAGLANAAGELLSLLENPPDLAIINRFGIMEAAGKGFFQEFLDLVYADIPVLTLLNSSKYLQQWREFTNNEATELAANLESLMTWFNTCIKNTDDNYMSKTPQSNSKITKTVTV
ncbi:DUF2478 domain-containing protein [Neisseria wadsworthii]|uniref:Molybdenum ABC superfamily ATP binding cassette transporter ABC protein n=1 Tax=Neisseria wadsworthii 9715 TaxID=1030841 RepID=G4CSV5_9NEIS|nr:DUF2478 domain-containing protein [Neisseria wadsworthii]EGZ44535.1 molybdenum ABC superfamily ATP binding cassette transporter ABC protein [Neisseria wadsworthii 9715]QMT35773.1 DUF2478 domain-containing protein [Neisseria wadsworthii]